MISNKHLTKYSVNNTRYYTIDHSSQGNLWEGFVLESGIKIPSLTLAYHTYGTLNEKKDNVVWIFHALTANSDAFNWWQGLLGDTRLINPTEHFIICVNMPGSCYGSISPLSINPLTGNPYYNEFPVFTTRDMIRAYQYLKNELGISKIRLGIGGSMGGQQLLEWAIEEPDLFETIVPIATNAFHSSWGIAFNTSQRLAIEADPTWGTANENAGEKGLLAARSIALLSYRNYESYSIRQKEESNDIPIHYRASTYQQYQGEKLIKRFNAYSYYVLTQTMDRHHVGRRRGTAEEALRKITAKTFVIGITSDILFPLKEQLFISENIPHAKFDVIHSVYGHDGFLIEFDQLEQILRKNKIVRS